MSDIWIQIKDIIDNKLQIIAKPRHVTLKLIQIEFTGNIIIEKDRSGTDLPQIQWKNNVEEGPVCFVCNKKAELKATFEIDGNRSKEEVDIMGKAKFDSITLEFSKTKVVAEKGKTIEVDFTSDISLPDYVACYENVTHGGSYFVDKRIEMQWTTRPSNSLASTAWTSLGSSRHSFFLTLKKPTTTKAQWTLLDISCRAAHKEKSPDKIVEKIFEAFKRGIGNGNGLIRKKDGKRLKYWGRGYETDNKNILLGKPEGRCGNWSQFLREMFETHGITDAKDILMVRDIAKFNSNAADVGFLVKNWKFSAAGSKAEPFDYEVLTECQMEVGIKAQGIDNAQPYFFDHVIVKYKDKFYDASYGVGPFNNVMDYEKAALDGLGMDLKVKNSGVDIKDFEGNKIYVPKEFCSKGFYTYTTVKDDTLSKIAAKFGINSYSALFNHEYNSEFRKNPNDPTKTRNMNDVYIGESINIPFELAKKINMLEFYYLTVGGLGSELEEKYRWS